MRLLLLKAKYGIDFKLPKNFFEILNLTFKKNSTLAIFCAVQFREKLDFVMSLILKDGFKIFTSKPFRTAIEGQILGCDSYKDSYNFDLRDIDGFVYVGDGYFHPNAMLLAQENEAVIKPVVLCNVVQQITEVISKEHIKKYLDKRKVNFLKWGFSKNVGVFITTKWGQEYLKSSLKLKEKYKDKNFYFFIGDNFLDNEVENFPYIDVWVNSACPRIGQDDILRHKKTVINIKDIW